MALDEARYAGLLNNSIIDFNLSLYLGKITKNCTYKFFPLE
jgi:magnesium-protoporphyrin IX monomethyl ester (oxidative) cyclase